MDKNRPPDARRAPASYRAVIGPRLRRLLALLFLLAGLIADERGPAQAWLDQAQPVARPLLLGGLFFVGAIGVAGLPPLAGFAAITYLGVQALKRRSD